MTVRILEGDVRRSLGTLPDEHFHCVVCSPPYWALRSYLPKDDLLKPLELGSEPTPEAHVEAMVGVFREVRRVLRSDGLCWVNYGDSYASQPSGSFDKGGRGGGALEGGEFRANKAFNNVCGGLKPGDRCLIPERFAIAMQRDGWILRDVIVWQKLSPMPESVSGTRWERHRVKVAIETVLQGGGCAAWKGVRTDPQHEGEKPTRTQWQDCPGCSKCEPNGGYVLRHGSWRTTRAHEVIFLFAKSGRYFADAEAVKEPCETATLEREKYTRILDDPDEQFAVKHNHESISGGKRNPRSVRTFKIENLKEEHYAAYPTDLPAWCITASTSQKGCCPTCGAQWAPVVKTTFLPMQYTVGVTEQRGVNVETRTDSRLPGANGTKVLSYRPTCQCPPHEPVRSRVLDPFGGSGSTAIAATKLCCDVTLCELNPKYVKMAWKRIRKVAGLFM